MQIRREQLVTLIYNRQFKNIFLSFVFRVGSILCNFLIVPLLIHQLSVTEYGILITIISISTWFTFVDFGLANGLKNKLSVSLVSGDLDNVRKYITSAYYALFKVVGSLLVILIISNSFTDWSKLMDAPEQLRAPVNQIFFYGLMLFIARLLAELVNPILLAYHKTAVSSFIAFIVQLTILIACYFFSTAGNRSFLQYGLVFFWVPFLIYSACNIYFYSTSFKGIRPSKEFFEKGFERSLFRLGGSFFVIQIAYLVIFTTDNLIIGRIFGYNEVSNYNIAYRYFNIPLFVIAIVLVPYWPILAEEYANKATGRIKKIIRKLLLFWLLIVLMSFAMLLAAPVVYSIWVGPQIEVSFLLNLGMFFFTAISSWNSIFATFVNSTSKLRLQTFSAVITGVLNIPLSIFLATKTSLGPSGVIFGTCICLMAGAVWGPIQCNKLINQKATGIWNK